MSVIHLQSIEVLNGKAPFADPYIFKITFECISPLKDDLEWKLIYVGSAESEEYDQELDNCLVGPVPVGVNSFEFEADCPSSEKIPAKDLLGVTVILLTALYNGQEFIRVGYYVNNDYEDEALRENPPEEVDLTKVRREVLVSKPRVTRFNIKWWVPAQRREKIESANIALYDRDAEPSAPVSDTLQMGTPFETEGEKEHSQANGLVAPAAAAAVPAPEAASTTAPAASTTESVQSSSFAPVAVS